MDPCVLYRNLEARVTAYYELSRLGPTMALPHYSYTLITSSVEASQFVLCEHHAGCHVMRIRPSGQGKEGTIEES